MAYPYRAVAVIGYPLDTTAKLLDDFSPDTNTGFDVRCAYDHEEAAGFIAADFDNIVAGWTGTDEGLAYLRGFLRAFLHH